MQAAYDGMQEVAGYSNLHAGGFTLQHMHAACMQVACSLHYASNVAASMKYTQGRHLRGLGGRRPPPPPRKKKKEKKKEKE